MGILNGNPQEEPLHYGEIFSLWSYLSAAKQNFIRYQTFFNHAGDQELKKFIKDQIQNEISSEIEQLEIFLKDNGIELPPSAPERPNANTEDIPVGARFNDPEIANIISMDISTGLTTCSQVIGQSIREDIGMMFSKFHSAKIKAGNKILQLNKDKGWLIPPPLQQEKPEPALV